MSARSLARAFLINVSSAIPCMPALLMRWINSMRWDNEKDVVAITGGASGLGRQLALKLKDKGFKVVVLDVTDCTNEENLIYFKCDVSNVSQVERAAKIIEKKIGIVTVLINNAGVMHGKALLDLSYEEINKTINVNLMSSFITIKTFLPGMLDRGRGYVVLIASVLAYISPSMLSIYF